MAEGLRPLVVRVDAKEESITVNLNAQARCGAQHSARRQIEA